MCWKSPGLTALAVWAHTAHDVDHTLVELLAWLDRVDDAVTCMQLALHTKPLIASVLAVQGRYEQAVKLQRDPAQSASPLRDTRSQHDLDDLPILYGLINQLFAICR